MSAGRARFDGDAVSGFEARYFGASGYDGAGGFVAQNHGVFEDERSNAALCPVVDVGTADAGVVHSKEDIVRVGGGRERRLWLFFEGDFVGRVENKREVLLPQS